MRAASFDPAANALVEDDNRVADVGQRRRILQRVIARVSDEHEWRLRVGVGELMAGGRVLSEDNVTVSRQLGTPHDTHPSPPREVCHQPRIRRVDPRLMTEAVELLGDGQRVGFGAARPVEVLKAQKRSHAASCCRTIRSLSW